MASSLVKPSISAALRFHSLMLPAWATTEVEHLYKITTCVTDP